MTNFKFLIAYYQILTFLDGVEKTWIMTINVKQFDKNKSFIRKLLNFVMLKAMQWPISKLMVRFLDTQAWKKLKTWQNLSKKLARYPKN